MKIGSQTADQINNFWDKIDVWNQTSDNINNFYDKFHDRKKNKDWIFHKVDQNAFLSENKLKIWVKNVKTDVIKYCTGPWIDMSKIILSWTINWAEELNSILLYWDWETSLANEIEKYMSDKYGVWKQAKDLNNINPSDLFETNDILTNESKEYDSNSFFSHKCWLCWEFVTGETGTECSNCNNLLDELDEIVESNHVVKDENLDYDLEEFINQLKSLCLEYSITYKFDKKTNKLSLKGRDEDLNEIIISLSL